MAELCFGCFTENENKGHCPICGYEPSIDAGKFPNSLPHGSILKERYIVGRVMGQGGFGITYAALDFATKKLVAIKEYLPEVLAGRDSTGSVRTHSAQRSEDFDQGKLGFLDEANTLVDFKENSHIVNIHDFFEENGTAYFVMEFVRGMSLKKYVKSMGGRLGEEEANRILLPIMNALCEVHAKGIIHRDIAPDNIIVTAQGSAKLIDFGAARYSTGEKSQSLDVILKHGYAPKEQYTRRGKQGPFTDVYAMAATYYFAVTGRVPPDAIDRTEEESLIAPSTLGIELARDTEAALMKALEVQHADRYQSMGEFMQALKGQTEPEKAPENKPEIKGTKPEKENKPEKASGAKKKPQISLPKTPIAKKAAPEGKPGKAETLIQKHSGLICKISAVAALVLFVISIGGVSFAFQGASLAAGRNNLSVPFYIFTALAWIGYLLIGAGLWLGRRAMIVPTAMLLALSGLFSFTFGSLYFVTLSKLCSLVYAVFLLLALRAERPLLPAAAAVLSQLAHVIVIGSWRGEYSWIYTFSSNTPTMKAIQSYVYSSDQSMGRFLLIRLFLCIIALAICALPPVTEGARSLYLKPLCQKIKKLKK